MVDSASVSLSPTDRNPWIEKIWLGLVFLFGLSLLTSKSGLTLFAPLLILWSLVDPKQFKMWSQFKFICGLMVFFLLALACNALSLAGSLAVVKVLTMWHWPLLAAPSVCIYQSRKARQLFLKALGLGLLISTIYALFNALKFYVTGTGVPFLSDTYRIASFWDIGRWGYFVGLAVLILFFLLLDDHFKKIQKISICLFLLSFISLILSNSRAPYIGLIAVLTLFSGTSLKVLKRTILFVAITFSLLLLNRSLYERVTSIFAVSVHSSEITSSHKSNASRLYMWKVALDFYQQQPWFGTGLENSEKPLKAFLDSQDASYVQNVSQTEFSFNDQHSSYMNSLVQMGLLFSIIVWCYLFIFAVKALFVYFKTKDYILRLSLAGILYSLVIFVFYSSFYSYETAIFFILLAVTYLRIQKIQPDQKVDFKNTSN